jgi:hypothetical protein
VVSNRADTLKNVVRCESKLNQDYHMKFSQRLKEAGATGYILLWLLGIPIPILFIIFLLRGCS